MRTSRTLASRGRALLTVLALLMASTAATPAAAAQQVDPETLRLLLARGEALLDAGDAEAGMDALERLFARAESIDTESPEPLRLLLQRALETRAVARWDSGKRGGLDADLDRLIRLDPGYDLAARNVDEGLIVRFNRRRERLVGFLRVGLAPADAELVLDGVAVERIGDIIPVLAGDHVVSAHRRGFAPQAQEVSVRANRTEGVGLTLERSSATVQVATDPSGARVVLDGEFVGTTAATGEGPASAPLVVEGLLPGWHEIEITLANHRPFRQRFEVPTLTDYDLGTLDMRLAVGTVTLRNVPGSAEVWVDGESVAAARSGDGSIRLQLTVGDHDLLIGASGGRVWSGNVTVVDGGTASRDTRLAPGLAFLGVAGGDALDRESANEPILRALSQTTGWNLLDRRSFAAGLSAKEALELGDGTQQELRRRFEDETPAGIFVIGAFDQDDLGIVHLNIWAARSALPPARVSIPQGDPNALREALQALALPLPAARSWHGLVLLDGPLSPIVGAVATESPAASAGFATGDRLLSLDGRAATTTRAFNDWVVAAGPQHSVNVAIERGGHERSLRLDLDSSPQVAATASPVTALSWWARSAAGIAAGDRSPPAWALHLQQVLLLIDSGQIDAAADMLWDAAAPANSPFGQAAVDYWLGVTLTMGTDPNFGAARNALNRAARVPDARLFHNDGPFIGPRARARIARIAATTER